MKRATNSALVAKNTMTSATPSLIFTKNHKCNLKLTFRNILLVAF
ncbi:MAG: hypothetical protein ACI4IG_05850 [Eubacterium sp.]